MNLDNYNNRNQSKFSGPVKKNINFTKNGTQISGNGSKQETEIFFVWNFHFTIKNLKLII